MILSRLFARFHRPDPIEDREEFVQRLEDEARREQGISDAFARVYREPVQRQSPRPTPLTRKLKGLK